MASFLDTGLVSFFSIIFSFIFVYAVVWGLLQWRKPFGDNKGLYAIVALMAAFLMIISAPAREFIEYTIPWFLALMMVFFLIIIVFSIFAEIKWFDVVKDSTVHTIIIILIIVIVMAGVFHIFGQKSLSYTNPSAEKQNVPVMTENGTYIQQPIGGAMPTNGMQATGVQYTSEGMPLPGRVGPTGTPEFETNLVNTMVHPKVLGLVIILVISAIVIYFLSKPAGGL